MNSASVTSYDQDARKKAPPSCVRACVCIYIFFYLCRYIVTLVDASTECTLYIYMYVCMYAYRLVYRHKHVHVHTCLIAQIRKLYPLHPREHTELNVFRAGLGLRFEGLRFVPKKAIV